MQTEFKANFT